MKRNNDNIEDLLKLIETFNKNYFEALQNQRLLISQTQYNNSEIKKYELELAKLERELIKNIQLWSCGIDIIAEKLKRD